MIQYGSPEDPRVLILQGDRDSDEIAFVLECLYAFDRRTVAEQLTEPVEAKVLDVVGSVGSEPTLRARRVDSLSLDPAGGSSRSTRGRCCLLWRACHVSPSAPPLRGLTNRFPPGNLPFVLHMLNPLGDESWVIRGGLMLLEPLCISAKDGLIVEGFHNLTFWGEDDKTVDEIAREADLPHGQIRVSTIGKLRALGHEPYRSEPWPHLTVRFEAEPTDDELEALVGVFDDPIQNPHPKG